MVLVAHSQGSGGGAGFLETDMERLNNRVIMENHSKWRRWRRWIFKPEGDGGFGGGGGWRFNRTGGGGGGGYSGGAGGETIMSQHILAVVVDPTTQELIK